LGFLLGKANRLKLSEEAGIKRFLAILLLVLSVLVVSGCEKKERQLRKGDVPPTVSLADLNGNMADLPADFKGKVAVVLLWYEDCDYCKEEMPHMEPLYRKLRGEGLVIVAVQLGENTGSAERLAYENDITFPMLLDPESLTKKRYGVVGVPMMIILGRDNTVKKKIMGGLDMETLEKIVRDLF
jgi:peroxiredoxin